MKDDIRQFLLQSLKEMNYSTEGIEDDTVLGPAGADLQSLALAELAVRVEDQYGVRFDDDEAEMLAGMTVGEFAELVASRAQAGSPARILACTQPPARVSRAGTGSRPHGQHQQGMGHRGHKHGGHRHRPGEPGRQQRRRGVRGGLRGPLRRRRPAGGPSAARPARRGRLQPRHRSGERAAGHRGARSSTGPS